MNRLHRGSTVWATGGRRIMAGLVGAAVLALSLPAAADRSPEYDPNQAGHPFKIVYYALYPIGFVLDVLILRPAHWLGQHEPFRTVFGVGEARDPSQIVAALPPGAEPPAPEVSAASD
ncbi:MAG: hypothetical protein VCC02_06330 [Myxococcota bacterium]